MPEFGSEKIRKKSYNNESYQVFGLYGDYYKDIAIAEQAINCDLDLWHDPALTSSIFISDELKKALAEAGMGTDWLFYECQIIDC